MDEDSSYGGSETNELPNSSQECATGNNLDDDHSGNYKNEISITIKNDKDETDFKNLESSKSPHYLSTTKLNVNENEGGKSGKEKTKEKIGLDNPAFEEDNNKDDTMGYTKGNLNDSSNNKKDEQPQAEAVNLELINLKPNGKDVAGPYENGKNPISTATATTTKKENYDEYFVPVNEHRKYMSYFPYDTTPRNKSKNSVTFAETTVSNYTPTTTTTTTTTITTTTTTTGIDDFGLSVTTPERGILDYPNWLNIQQQKTTRGEKLYVTKDKREKSKRNKCLCWGLCLTAVVAVIVIGILAALGIIGNSEPKTIGGDARTFGPSAQTTIVKNDSFATTIEVSRTLEVQMSLITDNNKELLDEKQQFEELLKEILFKNFTEGDIYLRVINEFNKPNNGSVKFRIGWVFKDEIKNSKDPVDKKSLKSKLETYLEKNNDRIDEFYFEKDSILVDEIEDLCKTNNYNGCEYGCLFNYETEEFMCECTDGQIIQVGGSCQLIKQKSSSSTTTTTTSTTTTTKLIEETTLPPFTETSTIFINKQTSISTVSEISTTKQVDTTHIPDTTLNTLPPIVDLTTFMTTKKSKTLEEPLHNPTVEIVVTESQNYPTTILPSVETTFIPLHRTSTEMNGKNETDADYTTETLEQTTDGDIKMESFATTLGEDDNNKSNGTENEEVTTYKIFTITTTRATPKTITHRPELSRTSTIANNFVNVADTTTITTTEDVPKLSGTSSVTNNYPNVAHRTTTTSTTKTTNISEFTNTPSVSNNYINIVDPTTTTTTKTTNMPEFTTIPSFSNYFEDVLDKKATATTTTTNKPELDANNLTNVVDMTTTTTTNKLELDANNLTNAVDTTTTTTIKTSSTKFVQHPMFEDFTVNTPVEPEVVYHPSEDEEEKFTDVTNVILNISPSKEENNETTTETFTKGVAIFGENTEFPVRFIKNEVTTEKMKSNETVVNVTSSGRSFNSVVFDDFTTATSTDSVPTYDSNENLITDTDLFTTTTEIGFTAPSFTTSSTPYTTTSSTTTTTPSTTTSTTSSTTTTTPSTTTSSTSTGTTSTTTSSTSTTTPPPTTSSTSTRTTTSSTSTTTPSPTTSTPTTTSSTSTTTPSPTTSTPTTTSSTSTTTPSPTTSTPTTTSSTTTTTPTTSSTSTTTPSTSTTTPSPTTSSTTPFTTSSSDYIRKNAISSTAFATTMSSNTSSPYVDADTSGSSTQNKTIPRERELEPLIIENNLERESTIDDRRELTTSTVPPRLDNDEKNVTNPLDLNVTDVTSNIPMEQDDDIQNSVEAGDDLIAMETTTSILQKMTTYPTFINNVYQVHEITDDITTTSTLTTPIKMNVTEPLAVLPLDYTLYEYNGRENNYNYTEEGRSLDDNNINNDDLTDESFPNDQEDDGLIATDYVNRSTFTTKTFNPNIKPVVEGYSLPIFSRCLKKQFQCLNGTSKSGSYCVWDSDRCDSKDDCSDGSDEIGCKEDNCLSNFQCENGQCLSRHLVCDGIFHCDDKSDENNCESWTCKSDELSCGNGTRCIPLVWKCNGNSNCPDNRDEENCGCESNQFECYEQNYCISSSWMCDGFPDCKNGQDEKLCECGIDKFKCKTGGGCIAKENRCDGIEHCPDRSDEWDCIKLEEEEETNNNSSTLLVPKIFKSDSDSSDSWIPICKDSWSDSLSNSLCKSLGFSHATSTNYTNANNSIFFKWNSSIRINDKNNLLLTQLEKTDTCDKIVTLTCEQNVCGINEQDISKFTNIDESGSEKVWPSLGLLFNKKTQTYCTANVISPQWLITSYDCLLSYYPEEWEFKIGGRRFFDKNDSNSTYQLRTIDNIVTHPQAKYSQFVYKNNIALIHLKEPLNINENISSICLPKSMTNNNDDQIYEHCITVGWMPKKPGDLFIQDYMQTIRGVNRNEKDCNSTDYYNGHFTSDMLCVDKLSSEACANDHGAALMCWSDSYKTWELEGLLSFDGNCQKVHRPSLFTTVRKDFVTWIEKTIGQRSKNNS